MFRASRKYIQVRIRVCVHISIVSCGLRSISYGFRTFCSKTLGKQVQEEARKQYENAWIHWKQIFEKYPTMISRDTGQNLEPSIANYMELLGQFDEQLPDDFELKELVATLEFAPRTLPESNIQFPSPSQPNRIKGQVPSQDYLKNK